jgi:hypothetical protein
MKKEVVTVSALIFYRVILIAAITAVEYLLFKYDSHGFNSQTSHIYEKILDKEHTHLEENKLPFQGKQKGMVIPAPRYGFPSI